MSRIRVAQEIYNRIFGKKPKKLTEAQKQEIKEMADELFGTDAEIAAMARTDIPPVDRMSINPPTRGGMMARQVFLKNYPASPYGKGLSEGMKSLLSPRSILNPRTDADIMRVGKLGIGMGAAAGAGVYDATEGFTEPYNPANSILFNPEEIGKNAAQAKISIDEALANARQAVGDAVEVPQNYFRRVEQGYNEEMLRQQELKNIKEFGFPYEPEIIPESGEIRPVSLFFATGGPAMSDNEPRFETRSPENQMFSIENEINNLMKSYNMLVDAKEFGRAQEVANQIDQLQQQKIGIQAQNDPQQDEITRILDSISI